MKICVRYLSHNKAADFIGPSDGDLSGFYWTTDADRDLDPQGPHPSEDVAFADAYLHLGSGDKPAIVPVAFRLKQLYNRDERRLIAEYLTAPD